MRYNWIKIIVFIALMQLQTITNHYEEGHNHENDPWIPKVEIISNTLMSTASTIYNTYNYSESQKL